MVKKGSKQPAVQPVEEKREKKRSEKAPNVIGFYGDKEGKPYCEFSNFYRQAQPFEYVLPDFAQREGFPTSVWCGFSEKAIMVTKAALMNDLEIFNDIVDASDPKSCKSLGRGVRDFNEELWMAHLEEVAFEVVRQKFSSSKSLRSVLLSTGESILAEAAPNDCIWGIGLPMSDTRVQDPSQWRGRNVLGNALMRTREVLRGNFTGPSGTQSTGATMTPDKSKNVPASVRVLNASSASNENSTVVVPAVHETEDAPTAPSENVPVVAASLPVMEDFEGSPLLFYRDASGTGGDRLSATAAAAESIPMRLIFLDVDGVLNNKSHTSSGEDVDASDLLLPECLNHLSRVLLAARAHVVISSTWRSYPELRVRIVSVLEQMRPGCVVGQTPQHPSYRNDMRPAEIASFLEEPPLLEIMRSKGLTWCAVDDMDLIRQAEALKTEHSLWKLLPALKQGFVRTDKHVGLDDNGAASILQALVTASANATCDNCTEPGATARAQKGKRPR